MTVYRGFDQDALEHEYNARGTVPDEMFDDIIGRYATESARMRETMACRLDVPFGPSPDEVVDIFPAGPDAPVFVWVHGGYWRMLSHKESSFMAETFVGRGAAVVAVNYSLAPVAHLDTIVDQCRRAIAWIYHNAQDHGIDRERIYIGGSSAGGHLVGMLIAAGWQADAGVPTDVIKGCCALSGIYDLEPILHSLPNSWLGLDADAAYRNSPIHFIPEHGGCPLIVSYGGNETSEFKRQTDEFAAAWRGRGFEAEHIGRSDTNHFDIVFDFLDPEGVLTRAVFGQMGL